MCRRVSCLAVYGVVADATTGVASRALFIASAIDIMATNVTASVMAPKPNPIVRRNF